jgi:hypothetical protein
VTAPPQTGGRTYNLGAVLPHVRRAAELVGNRFGVATILGWRATARDKLGHPAGLALDYMCDRAQGDQINAYLHANAAALGLKYTIWLQTYHPVGGAPEPMEDRGSPTQNHLDHVHAQFKATGGDGTPLAADFAGVSTSTGATASGGGLFDGWAGDVLAIGVKVAATGAALALVVTGVRQTVKS